MKLQPQGGPQTQELFRLKFRALTARAGGIIFFSETERQEEINYVMVTEGGDEHETDLQDLFDREKRNCRNR